jgi:mono/diheme cytochrome c family protein
MRGRIVLLVVLLAGVGFLAAGCLDGKQESATPDQVVGTLPATTTGGGTSPASGLKGDATAGKAVFTSAGCVACHTLKAAGSTGTVGPNLDKSTITEARAIKQVEHGGGPMPAFKGKLTPAQITAVAHFIVTSRTG